MPKSFKAVLVPQSQNPWENSQALSKEFRYLLSKLAQQHLQELAMAQRSDSNMSASHNVQNQLSAVWNELNSLRSQVASPTGNGHGNFNSSDGFGSLNSSDGFQQPSPPAVHQPPLPNQENPPMVSPQAALPGEVDSDEEVSPKKTKMAMVSAPADDDDDGRRRSLTSTSMGSIELPPQSFYMKGRDLLSSVKFDLFIGLLILVNVMFMFLQCQYDGIQIGHELMPDGEVYDDYEYWRWYPKSAQEVLPGVGDMLFWIDRGFTIIFTLDVSAKIIFLGMPFWQSPLNLLDFVVVLLGIYALATPSFQNPSYMRMLRLAKIGRLAGALKNSAAVQSLQMLLKCISSSVTTLGWSLGVVVVLQSIMGLTISSLVHGILEDENSKLGEAEKNRLFYFYGTFTKTMFTMFEVLFANWIPSARALIDNVSEVFIPVFVIYRCFIGFAVLSVVRAVFVQSTMKVAQQDEELLIAQKQRANESNQKNLRKLFKQMDTSGDGELSYDELSDVVNNPKMKLWMSALDIDTHDLEALFKLLDDGDGSVTIDEFLGGIGRLKGPAKAIDLATVLVTVNKVDAKLEMLQKKVKKLRKTV